MSTPVDQMEPVSTQNRSRWVVTLVAVAATLALVFLTLSMMREGPALVDPADTPTASTEFTPTTDPLEMAHGYLDARSAGDVDGMLAVLAPNAVVDDLDQVASLNELAWRLQFMEAVHTTHGAYECSETLTSTPERVTLSCRGSFEDDLSRAVNLGPTTIVYGFVIEDGAIIEATSPAEYLGVGYSPKAWVPFHQWMIENHPGEMEDLFEMPDDRAMKPRYSDQNIETFATRVQEYAEDVAGS